jgi:2-deoxy-D-gluconate 3-dehydrogenase
MDIRLDNKVALVTGGANGIGLACAEMLAASGAQIAIVDYDAEALPKAVEVVSKQGPAAKGYLQDVREVSALEPLVGRIRKEVGEIDILVCSAGINIPELAHEVTEETWDAIHRVNLRGLFFCNQAVAVQSMMPRRRGVIINIASQMGLVGGVKRAAYCASKGGVVMMSKAEAIDWADYDIRVNVVAPTFVKTRLSDGMLSDPDFKQYILDNILFHRLATLEDVASAVCFLSSDEAGMITGIALPVDGGWTAH